MELNNCILNDAPELSIFLSTVSSNPLSFCGVCLRTAKERRLVKPVTFKKFVTATNIGESWARVRICYMCERQASKAMTFYNACTFAATIRAVFAKLLRNNTGKPAPNCDIQSLQEGLNRGNTTRVLEQELMMVRRSTDFMETEVLAIDSSGMQVTMSKEKKDVYLIPDDPEVVINDAPNSDTDVLKSKVNVSKVIDVIPNIPKLVQAPRRTLNIDGEPETTSIVNDVKIDSSEDIKNELPIIIYDDDDSTKPLNPQYPAIITPQHNLSQKTLEISKLPNIGTTNFLDTQNVPTKVVPLNQLVSSNQKLFIHPITINEGVITVPTLNANIVNGNLVSQNGILLGKNVLKNYNNDENNLPELPPLTKGIVNQDNNFNMNMPNIISTRTIPISERTDVNVDNKRGVDCLGDGRNGVNMATLQKKAKLPEEKNKERTVDWEDKIPMDVISFMDAVDPNAPLLPGPPPDPPMGAISEVRSLAVYSKADVSQNSTVFIDLC